MLLLTDEPALLTLSVSTCLRTLAPETLLLLVSRCLVAALRAAAVRPTVAISICRVLMMLSAVMILEELGLELVTPVFETPETELL